MTDRAEAYKRAAIKRRETMIKKYGSVEAYKEHQREVATKGGHNLQAKLNKLAELARRQQKGDDR